MYTKDPTGLIVLVSLTAMCGHSLFRYFKQEIRTFNYSRELARNPTPENAKSILLRFLSEPGHGTEKNSLKSVVLSSYLFLCKWDSDPKSFDPWGGSELLVEHDKFNDKTSLLRINEAIDLLSGNLQEMTPISIHN